MSWWGWLLTGYVLLASFAVLLGVCLGFVSKRADRAAAFEAQGRDRLGENGRRAA